MRPYNVEDIKTKIPKPHESLQHLLEAHKSAYPREHATLLDAELDLRFYPNKAPMNVISVATTRNNIDRSGNPVALGGWNVSR